MPVEFDKDEAQEPSDVVIRKRSAFELPYVSL